MNEDYRVMRVLLWAGAVVATGALLGLFIWAALEYGGAATIPEFAAGAAATALGVFLALVIEREVSMRRDEDAALRAATQVAEDRRSEARLAFGALAEELQTLERGLLVLVTELPHVRFVSVELPTGSWRAVDERLGQILGDFELLSAVARCYGRVDDVQRALATRELTGFGTDPSSFTYATEAARDIIDSALVSVRALRPRIAAQISAPTIRA